ncbi:MAG TPA: nucleotidyltransferase domain-containing protein [Geobacteraceae bacterium]|nr:nucleotidyltransferase domain-containing protein [Geobacteraceae bacterium]
MTDHETVQEIVQRLVAAAHPEQIILFGSRARDEARDDSDVDLLVIESEPFGPQRSRLWEIGRLESAIGRLSLATDLLVYSRVEVERWRDSPRHVIGRALREGRVLYARH